MTRAKKADELARPKVDLDKLVEMAHDVQLEGGLILGPTLAELTGLNVNQVRYYLRTARAKGMKVDLDHTPTEAVIHRNSAHEHEWEVCRTCLVPWPCQVVAHRVEQAARRRGAG